MPMAPDGAQVEHPRPSTRGAMTLKSVSRSRSGGRAHLHRRRVFRARPRYCPEMIRTVAEDVSTGLKL